MNRLPFEQALNLFLARPIRQCIGEHVYIAPPVLLRYWDLYGKTGAFKQEV